ncbi:MAG: hypothetical protein Q8O03_01285 [Nanoarchaeota archaeon]|nr:hypothetical protein [Nanoarchaeota archaeon]
MEESKDKDKGLESWLKRLASEPLRPSEETEKKEQYLTKRQLDNMVDPEEVEKEYFQDEKRLEQRKRDYRISGTDYQRPKTKYGY